MSRRQSWTVGELVIEEGGGIRAGLAGKLLKTLRALKYVPAAKVANRYFASAAMHNGAYTIANSGLPGDGLAHNVTCAETTVGAEDTNGILTITGLDIDGKIITENITPDSGVTVSGNMAFKQVTSIVGSSWITNTGDDTIVIGFGDKIGFPELIASAADVFLAALDTAIIQAPTLTVSSTVLANNTITVVGNGTLELKVVYGI